MKWDRFGLGMRSIQIDGEMNILWIRSWDSNLRSKEASALAYSGQAEVLFSSLHYWLNSTTHKINMHWASTEKLWRD